MDSLSSLLAIAASILAATVVVLLLAVFLPKQRKDEVVWKVGRWIACLHQLSSFSEQPRRWIKFRFAGHSGAIP